MKPLIFMFFLMMTSSLGFAQVDSSLLSIKTQKSFDLVPEFKFIREEAAKMGVDVYLFGGSAAAFGHYVRWDVERKQGDTKYQEERFDYDFTNIYRGNQDLDLVVDGTAEQAAAFEQILMKAYPHFVGNKQAWEVRLLRAQIGDKLQLLKDPDFLNQHTDTNSTGLLALTAKPDEIVFRDLFDWESKDSNFLKDVATARIKFLFSDDHSETTRFKDGKNPPVFAAIRYLAKLAQYEVTEFKGDLDIIKKIVEEAGWEEIKNNDYVRHKLEEFGKKVLLNAPDSEYAWDLLEKTGFRKRLITMDGDQTNKVETLSWWMNKEPLRSSKVGEGKGKTAAEIFKGQLDADGDIVVSHETSSFLAYENITRSSKGMANAFISRKGVSGEAAAQGDGFYTKIGRAGARGTNLTIRFILNPNAKEGADFIYEGDYIVVKNKKAMKLIQEDLNISMVDFFKLLMSNGMDESDKGLLEKFKRKFGRVDTSSDEFKKAVQFVRDSLFITDDFPEEYSFNVSSIKFESFEDLVNLFIGERRVYYSRNIIDLLKSKKFTWKAGWVQALIDKGAVDREVVYYVLSQELWGDQPELVQALIDRGTVDKEIATHVLSKAHWKNSPKLVQALIDRGTVDKEIATHVLSRPHWKNHPGWVQAIMDRGTADGHIEVFVLSRAHWRDHPEWVQAIIDRGTADENIVRFVLSKAHWKNHPEWIQTIIDRGTVDSLIGALVLSKAHWKDHPHLLKYLNGKEVSVENIRKRGKKIKYIDWIKTQSLSCKGILR